MPINNSVKPWARGPLELLQHAEEHRLGKRDFDRRVALIGFDNAIESSVITYLSLNPVQRSGRSFPKVDVERWLANFHSKVEFLEHFAGSIQRAMPIGPPEFIYYHRLRNELYHNGNGMVPAEEHITGARQAAVWTFSTLFECDAEALLQTGDGREQQTAGEAGLSAPTAFLESFIDAKKELDELLGLMNKAVKGQPGLDRLLQLVQENESIPKVVVEATLQAEKTKDLIVRGDDREIDETALRSLTTKLGSAAEHFRQRLRFYQHDIVEAAVESTLAAFHRDGQAGIVTQAAGTGLTMTVVAYLARCREADELSELPCIVLVDRVDLAKALLERVRDLPGHPEQISMLMPDSALALDDALKIHQLHLVVVTTWQQLRAMRTGAGYDTRYLVVCFNLVQAGAPDFDLRTVFRRGTFILFGSTPLRDDERRFGLFGHLIRGYDYRAAVVDGSMLPVRIEQRHKPASAEDPFEGHLDVGVSRDLTAAQVRAISSDVLKDFSDTLKRRSHRAVLVAKSRASVAALAHELKRLSRDRLQPSSINDLVVVQLDAGTNAREMFDASAGPSICVSTVNRLIGIDFGPSVTCYVTCKVSLDAMLRLISMVARPRSGAEEALIVDYASNSWEIVNESTNELLPPIRRFVSDGIGPVKVADSRAE